MSSNTYKTREWVEKQFPAFIERQTEMKAMIPVDKKLSSLIRMYPNDWSDFCVLEGIESAIAIDCETDILSGDGSVRCCDNGDMDEKHDCV